MEQHSKPSKRVISALPSPVVQDAVLTRQESLLDEALMETFPASDPISPSVVN
ncbi:hypothetical protein [Paraburkholderia sp.]|jgi:hypothetical protein|uniref:hypothetical protein n=1 Tax=Paraburkholderia sp. TaxID=1926495 RepID=UPI002F3E995A